MVVVVVVVVGEGFRNFKLLPDISFDSGIQKLFCRVYSKFRALVI